MALVVGIVLLAGLVLVASAVAGEDQRYAEADAAYPDDAGPTSAQPTAAQTREALESPDAPRLEEQAPDPEAAAELPHRDLGREEALELAEAVFGGRLKSSAGIFDELEPARYLSDYAAVLPSEGAQSGKPPTAAIVESSLPLRTEAADGSEEPVDLSLNSSEGELQPENPLIEVGIPHELGQGISIPGVGVSVELADAPADREATNVEGDFGFYPNVAENTDLVVAPVPTGVETFADIRSAEAPQSETFRLSMPPGASLEATPEGGAEVVSGAQTLVNVPAPIATDAAGAEVPVDLEVGGNSITLTTETSPDTAFPVLLDPAFLNEEFQWWLHHDSLSGWTGSTSAASYQPVPYAFFWGTNYPGPDLTSGFGGSAPSGTAATWVHTVPRYYQDINEFGTPPASYIHELFTEGLMFLTHGNTSSYPALITGLADPKNGWANYGTHFGTQGDLNSLTNHFQFLNVNEQTNEKLAEMALVTYEAEASAKLRDTYIGNAAVVVADTDAPTVTELRSPSQWMNATAVPIPYGFSDLGLGVRGAIITAPGESSSHPGWGRDFACAGTNVNPCPRSAKSTEPGRLPLNYNPAELPTGIDKLTVTVGDATWATGHVAAETVKVRVDHAAPALSLSGTLTEQGTLGTEKPQYTLKYSATDGTEEAPSFISAFGSEGTAAGQFKHPADVAVDSSSNVWVSDQNNNRIERQNSKGEFASFGALGSGNGQFKGPTGIEADSAGNVWVADTGNNRVEELNAKGEFLRAFGGFGSANGKLSAPQGIAIDSAGNVWVADTGNNRVEEFSSTGTFLGTFGSKGSEVGQLSEPTALDVGPGGNVWVADTGNNRIEEFSESGEFIAAYGTLGSGNGQFNHPDAIDVDTWGNVWVGDQANGRVEQFSERGEYLGKFGTSGTGAGQFSFSAPIGLASSYSGKLWVVDSGNNRVENWNAPQGLQSGVRSVSVKLDGKVVQEPKLGCETGGCPLAGEWVLPSGEYAAGTHWLEVTAADGVGLTTTSTQKVTLNPPPPSLAVSGTLTEQATLGMTLPRYNLKLSGATEEGTGAPPVAAPSYRSSFGTLGSGNGQLNHPGGLALDAAGNVWVADKNNNRIEEFNAKGEYKASIGASGSGNGQLNGPTDLTIDAQGNLWVADTGNARIEEFSAAGEYLRAFGSIGAGTGQFAAPGPEGIAIDAKGNIWVSDTYGSRLEKFNTNGKFQYAAGSKGGAAGQLSEPSGIEVAANGNVWVTDWANQRVEVYNEAGEYVRQFGSEGSGERQFKHPNAIAIDPGGIVWVADQNNERVQEFNQSGRYLGQFGSGGSGAGQFSFTSPMGIAADTQGNLWVADTANNRVQRWREPARSVAKAEITLDGKEVESSEVLCTTETCPATLEWPLESTKYAAGPHVVVAKITDGFGRTTSKTVNVETQADTTKPALEVGGELANAPEGWVQQESYGFHAGATDAGGYGVTSLALKIDGATVASSSQSCGAGSCEASLTKSIDTSSYAGGSHPAEVVALDGAGNTTTHKWTINVDPEGHISTAEATDTLEALETTSDANLVGESEEETGIEGTAPGLGIEASEGQLEATGTQVPLTIDPEPGGGFTAEVPEASAYEDCGEAAEGLAGEEEFVPGEEKVGAEEEQPKISEPCGVPGEPEGNEEGMVAAAVVPLDVKEAAGPGNLVEENAVVSADTQSSADTVIRPLSDGGMVFAAIRDETAPEEYSWRIEMSHDQELKWIDEQHAEVYYNDSTPAFSITAEPAHDAIGTTVPTTLSVEKGNIVTLTVHYKAGHEGQPFVYPIIGGTGWEGGFQTTEIYLGEPLEEEDEEVEELEALASGDVIMGLATFGPPEEIQQLSAAELAVMELNPYEPNAKAEKSFRFDICHSHLVAGDPPPISGPDTHARLAELAALHFHCREPQYQGNYWRLTVQGKFHYVLHQRVWLNWQQWNCNKTGGDEIEWAWLRHCDPFFPNGAHYPSGKRFKGPIEVLGEWRFPAGKGQFADEAKPNCLTAGGLIYPNPRKSDEEGLYENPLLYHRPKWVELNEDCPVITPFALP